MGQVRLMERATLPRATLEWVLRSASRAVPVDAMPQAGCCSPTCSRSTPSMGMGRVCRWSGSALESRTSGEEVSTRELSAVLCLGQPLGGDSAYTVFESADLDEVLGVLGPRGYRAAHAEAGIVNGRLLPCAHALGHVGPEIGSGLLEAQPGNNVSSRF